MYKGQDSSPVADTIWLCPNEEATIKANITGGSFQQLQWQRNLTDITGSVTNSLLVKTEGLYRLRGGMACGQAASKLITVIKKPSAPAPVVKITASANAVCKGEPVEFTGTIEHGGMAPQYQWQVNSINAGTNSTDFSSASLQNNDVIKVIYKDSTICSDIQSDTSNSIVIAVNHVIPAISINGNTIVVAGQSSPISSSDVNTGNNPFYQWQDSTSQHNWQDLQGRTWPYMNYEPAKTGDKLRCILTSNAACADPLIVTSASLTFTVQTATAINPVPAADFGIKYFPNPVASILTIDSLKISDQWQTIEVTGIDGKQQGIKQNISNQKQVSLYVDKLPAGIYIAILKRKSGRTVYIEFARL